jgi:division protein CdvB (Snf7/Vps24/ESCRT-III family)
MAAVVGDADPLSRYKRIEEVTQLLDAALRIVDALGDLPALGAKLQGILDDINDEMKT